MDTNKLFKAIQIIVKEEVKKETAAIKEQVRKEILAEMKKTTPQPKQMVQKTQDPFERALSMLDEERHTEEKVYTQNPVLNQILNETSMRANFSRTDGEWGTITPDMIGYGNPQMGMQSPMDSVSTGNELIDKAIARSAKVLAASKDKNR
jgi:hypothetical protein